MVLSPRYKAPSFNRKPFGSHQFDVYSPKMSRQLVLFGMPALNLWTRLEATPSVLAFCERPLQLPNTKPRRAIDFWVQSRDSEEFLIIAKASVQDSEEGGGAIPGEIIDGIPLRYVSIDEMGANATELKNWGWIIRDLSAFQRFVPEPLCKEVLATVDSGKSIAQLQAALPDQDSSIVKLAVYVLLHRGQVVCNELKTQLLGPSHFIALP